MHKQKCLQIIVKMPHTSLFMTNWLMWYEKSTWLWVCEDKSWDIELVVDLYFKTSWRWLSVTHCVWHVTEWQKQCWNRLLLQIKLREIKLNPCSYLFLYLNKVATKPFQWCSVLNCLENSIKITVQPPNCTYM